MSEEQKENFIADNPVSNESEDRFQRYGFSKRIAETIIARKTKESIVFGLYGAWGEGKSSVLNFIRKEIEEQGEGFIQITFNPWRFNDELSLLTSFFKTIAKEVDSQKTNLLDSALGDNKDPLKSNVENLASLINKYGSIVSSTAIGGAIHNVAKAVSTVDIEELKLRIEKLLEKEKKRIVIYIDDIDRLDKSEVHSIFKLVKLTGDFSFTTYILSFDEKMVAAALADRYGSGDVISGYSFLEKIIQIPLELPKAQRSALETQCYDIINEILRTNNVEISKEDGELFVEKFNTHILPRLKTPRDSVRYGNALSFLIPMLKGEVNIVDLMLIEAVRIFYPDHYEFVKVNPQYFVEDYSSDIIKSEEDQKGNRFEVVLKKLEENFSDDDKEHIRELLEYLFPVLQDAKYKKQTAKESSEREQSLYSLQRIGSRDYFERYFTYSVLKGEISDLEIGKILQEMTLQTLNEKLSRIEDLIDDSSLESFISKLEVRENAFDWERSNLVVRILFRLSGRLPKSENDWLGMLLPSTYSRVLILISKLLRRFEEKEDVIAFLKEVISTTSNIHFSHELLSWLRSYRGSTLRSLDNQTYNELITDLAKRCIIISDGEFAFKSYPNDFPMLVIGWASHDKDALLGYIDESLKKDPENIIHLIKSHLKDVNSTGSQWGFFKTNLTEDIYGYLIETYGESRLYNAIIKQMPLERIASEEVYEIDELLYERPFTEENMLRQFIHIYEKHKKD